MISETAKLLIESVTKVDAATEPAGLYAVDKQVLWSKWLYPVLKRGGGKIVFSRPGRYVIYSDKSGNEGRIDLMSFSAIKVRKFGNRYAMDSTINYHERWDDRAIQKKLCDLWNAEPAARMFIIIGFDDTKEPFRKELEALAKEVDWNAHGLGHERKVWLDPRNRGFSCFVSLWEKK